MKTHSFISVVVYVYNDEKRIFNFLNYLKKELDTAFYNYEIICVNDNSSDDSIGQIKKFGEQRNISSLTIVNMGSFHGLEGSISAGVDISIGDFIYEFDSADTSIDFSFITAIYYKSLEGYDIVSASPNIKNSNSRLFYWIYNTFSGQNNKLQSESFRILSRRAVNRVYSMSNQILYRKALYGSCGLSTYNMVFQRRDSKLSYKTPKETLQSNSDTAIDSLLLFTKIGYSISLFLCIIMGIFAFSVGIYTVIIYFGHNKPVEGWAPIMGFMSAGFLGIFMIFTIIIKYLDLLLKLVFTKQKYLVKSIEKIK